MPAWRESPGALRLHVSPFNDRITLERRTLDESAAISRSGIWQIKQSVMRNVLPAFGSTVGSVLAAPGLRNAVLSGMHRALRRRQPRRHDVFARMDARHAEGSLEGPPYLQPVGVPASRLSETARRLFRVLQVVLQAASLSRQRRQRRQPPASGPRFSVQRKLFRPHVYSGALIERRTRLGRFSDRLQRFRVVAWRRAHVQSERARCSRNTSPRPSASVPSCSARCGSAPIR